MKRVAKIVLFVMMLTLLIGSASVPCEEVQAAKKFNVTKKAMKKAIDGREISVTVDGSEQKFAVKTSEIKKLKIKSKKYSKNRTKVKAVAHAYLNRDVLFFGTTYQSECSDRLVLYKWKLRFNNRQGGIFGR